MDEPFAEIDILGREKFFSLLKSIAQGKMLILVTHDVEMAITYSDRILSLKQGATHFEGPSADFKKIWSSLSINSQ